MLKKILALVQVTRPHNMLAASACAFAGYHLSGGRAFFDVFYPIMFTGLVVGCGNMINDYFDVEIDMTNKPKRPIPSGRLSKSFVARAYLGFSFILSIVIFIMLPISIMLWLFSWEVLLFLYAFKFKRIPLAGNLLVALVAASAFPFGSLLSSNLNASIFPFIFAFLFVMGRELIKGGEDLEGDRAAGAATLTVKLGKEVTLPIASMFLILCVVIAPLPAILNAYSRLYFFIMEFALVPGLLLTSYLLLQNPSKAMLSRASWLLKGEMFIGILAMTFSKTT